MSRAKIQQAGLLSAGLALGCALTLAVQHRAAPPENSESDEQPLYWVAPMDPEYRRDKPGKSPMGMDLIPVYRNSNDEQAGDVEISPAVINNLGVRSAVAQYRTWQTEIRTVGIVSFDEDYLAHIHPRVAGWIETLHVKSEGDTVERGQALYRIYSPTLINAQEEYLLALERNSPRLIKAAKDRLDQLQLPAKAVTQLARSRRIQQTITFTAPQSGVVDRLEIREGFYVEPGTTLMSIAALDPIRVDAEIFESQAALVAPGSPVTMSLDFFPDQQWRGQIDYVYPRLDAKNRTLKVRMRFANEQDRLKPGMFARVHIHSRSDRKALIVPREAVIRTGRQDRVVLALGGGRFRSVTVNSGRFEGNHVEILGGLAAGQRVVTSAQFLLDSESSKNEEFERMHEPGDAAAN